MITKNLFGGCMILFLALVSTKAIAADPVCTATVPCKDVVPSDCGAAHDELCTDETDTDLDGAWSDSSSKLDCDDANASVYPGALSVIGDGLDNDCDGNGDDAEKANALVAAGGEGSPKGNKLAEDIDLCVNGKTDGTFVNVWSHETGIWDCTVVDGFSYERGFGVRNESETHEVETARRIAGDKRAAETAKAAALAEIESAKAAIRADAEADKAYFTLVISKAEATVVELTAKIAEYDTRLSQSEIDARRAASVQKGVDAGQNVRHDNTESKVSALERTGPIFEIGLGGMFLAQRSLLVSEDGPSIRDGLVGGANVVVSTGYAQPGHSLTLDLSFGQGSTGSQGGTIPVTVASAAVVAQWRHEDMAFGPEVFIFGNATGNVLNPIASGWGGGAGVTASWFPETSGLRVEVKTDLGIGIESFGFDEYWDSGLMGKGGVTVLVGGGPRK